MRSVLTTIGGIAFLAGSALNLFALAYWFGPLWAILAFFVFPVTDVLVPLWLLLAYGGPLSILLTWVIPIACFALAARMEAAHSTR